MYHMTINRCGSPHSNSFIGQLLFLSTTSMCNEAIQATAQAIEEEYHAETGKTGQND